MYEGSDDGAFEIEGVCVGIGVGNAVGAVVVGFPVGGIKVVGWEASALSLGREWSRACKPDARGLSVVAIVNPRSRGR